MLASPVRLMGAAAAGAMVGYLLGLAASYKHRNPDECIINTLCVYHACAPPSDRCQLSCRAD